MRLGLAAAAAGLAYLLARSRSHPQFGQGFGKTALPNPEEVRKRAIFAGPEPGSVDADGRLMRLRFSLELPVCQCAPVCTPSRNAGDTGRFRRQPVPDPRGRDVYDPPARLPRDPGGDRVPPWVRVPVPGVPLPPVPPGLGPGDSVPAQPGAQDFYGYEVATKYHPAADTRNARSGNGGGGGSFVERRAARAAPVWRPPYHGPRVGYGATGSLGVD